MRHRRAHAEHADALRAPLRGQGARERLDPALGGDVVREATGGDALRGRGARVDDDPEGLRRGGVGGVVGLRHDVGRGQGAVEGAGEVGADGVVPALGRDVGGGFGGVDPGDVAPDVESVVPAGQLLGQRLAGGAVADVERVRGGRASLLAEGLRDGGGGLGVEVGHGDVGAGLGEARGGGAADARGAARDDGHAAVEREEVLEGGGGEVGELHSGGGCVVRVVAGCCSGGEAGTRADR